MFDPRTGRSDTFEGQTLKPYQGFVFTFAFDLLNQWNLVFAERWFGRKHMYVLLRFRDSKELHKKLPKIKRAINKAYRALNSKRM